MYAEQLLGSWSSPRERPETLPPVLARALDVHNMPRWKRIVLRTNWSGVSNWLFLLSMVFYVINSCWWLNDVHHLPYFPSLSGRHFAAICGLIGAIGFIIEPIVDIVGCWVEAWDEILWAAQQAAENLPSVHLNDPDTPAAAYTSRSAAQLMLQNTYFWAAVFFFVGSTMYMWYALVPFIYGDYCDACGFVWDRMWFACVDEAHGWPDLRRQLQIGNSSHPPHVPPTSWPKDAGKDHGYCAVLWFGSLIFLLDSLVALGGWWLTRAETNEFLGCERTLWPCRCRRPWPATDWLGWGSWGFLTGAVLGIVNGFVTNTLWDNMLTLAAQLLWCADAVLFLLDQAAMDAVSDVRKLPVVSIADEGGVEIRWEEDRDVLTQQPMPKPKSQPTLPRGINLGTFVQTENQLQAMQNSPSPQQRLRNPETQTQLPVRKQEQDQQEQHVLQQQVTSPPEQLQPQQQQILRQPPQQRQPPKQPQHLDQQIASRPQDFSHEQLDVSVEIPEEQASNHRHHRGTNAKADQATRAHAAGEAATQQPAPTNALTAVEALSPVASEKITQSSSAALDISTTKDFEDLSDPTAVADVDKRQ